jgi:hypothetical protein
MSALARKFGLRTGNKGCREGSRKAVCLLTIWNILERSSFTLYTTKEIKTLVTILHLAWLKVQMVVLCK